MTDHKCTCRTIEQMQRCPHAMTTGYAPCDIDPKKGESPLMTRVKNVNRIESIKYDRRPNMNAHLQSLAVMHLIDYGELINAAHAAIKAASDDIWGCIQLYGGCPAGDDDTTYAERRYWMPEHREKLMQSTHSEAAYRIWRSIQLNDGDPTHDGVAGVPVTQLWGRT